MSYKEKPIIKLYKYEDNSFILEAQIDDYAEVSFEHNLYNAGVFTITINFNIPNALLFERGMFVQFGNDPYCFGEIITIQDTIGSDGKGSQTRTITGYDARYILKRRVIKNLNTPDSWQMTESGEICMRKLIESQCGVLAEEKRQLPIINVIPEVGIGKKYSVSESFTNLYNVLVTIAKQTEIGWRIKFENNIMTLEFYKGEDLHLTVRFDTSFESLANGEFQDSAESYANSIYIGGKGTGGERDIFEGESLKNKSVLLLKKDSTDKLLINNSDLLNISGKPFEGMERYESWDNQSSMTTIEEYQAEAVSMLTQYGQTIQMAGNGLAKCPYIFKEQYNVGDWVTVAFSGKSAVVQILSVTEHWVWGQYDLKFSFGKPQNTLADQLQLMLRKIQTASDKTNSTDSVRWYTIPTDAEMPKGDVTYNTIGFIGSCAEGGSTFKLYLDDEKTGAKTYHVYFKQLGGGNITLTTGKAGASNLVLNSGTYVAIIYIDENGNVTQAGASPTNIIQSGNTQPATSGAVANELKRELISSGTTSLGGNYYLYKCGHIRELYLEGFSVPNGYDGNFLNIGLDDAPRSRIYAICDGGSGSMYITSYFSVRLDSYGNVYTYGYSAYPSAYGHFMWTV